MLRPFGRDDRGVTLIEYGLIAGAVALAVLTAFWTVGDSLRAGLSEVSAAIGLEVHDEGGRGIIVQTASERD